MTLARFLLVLLVAFVAVGCLEEPPPHKSVTKLGDCVYRAGFKVMAADKPPGSAEPPEVWWMVWFGDNDAGFDTSGVGKVDDPDGRIWVFHTEEQARDYVKKDEAGGRDGKLIGNMLLWIFEPGDKSVQDDLKDSTENLEDCRPLALEAAKHKPKNPYND